MNTAVIKKTTAAAVSRKLQTVGFEKWNGDVGFEAFLDDKEFGFECIVVFNRDSSERNNVAPELAAMGYEVMDYSRTTTLVYGKVAA